MNLFEIAAKIALDTRDFDEGIEKATSESKNVKTAINELTSPLDKVRNAFDTIAHPIQSVKDGFESLKTKVGNVRNVSDGLKAKVNETSTSLETQRNKLAILTSSYESAKSKVSDLTKEFNEAAKESGATSDKAKELADKLDKAEKEAYKAKTKLDELADKLDKAEKEAGEAKTELDEFSNSVKKTGDEEENTSKKTSTFGETLKAILASDVIKAGINALWNGVKKIGQLFIDVGKSAIEAYGNYEQLSDGAKKIFNKMDYSIIAKDAASAYKELNMSASQYLDSINLAGATFAQTMGDKKGYETARAGMLAIADYASGTGRNLEELNQKYQLITRATTSYQSIADQFSGILPGTSKDFLEQAQAAGYLKSSYEKLTEVPVVEYQQAVTKMLKKGVSDLGLSQNTLRESTETLTGSIAMTKAAWQNLLVGMADDNANFDELINNLVESVTAAFNNILPRIGTVISGIGKLIEGLAPVIVEKLPEVIDEAGPGIANAASKLVLALYNTLRNTLTDVDWQNFGKTIAEKINNIDWVSLIGNLGQTLSNLISGALNLLIGFVENVNWGGLGVSLFNSLVSLIINIDWGSLVSQAFQLLGAAISGAVSLVAGVSVALKAFLEKVKEDVMQYFNAKIEEAGGNVIKGLFNGILDAMNGINDWIEDNIVLPFINGFKNAFGIHSPSTVMKEQGGYIIDGFIDGIKALPKKALKKFDELKTKIKSWGNNLKSSIKNIGGNLITGLWNGINDKVSWITTKIESFGSAVINKIKGIFGIHSPSTVMKQIGNYLTQGLAIGIENGSDKPISAVASLGNDMTKAFNFNKAADITSKVSEVNSYIPSMISARNVSNNTNEILNRILDVLYQIDRTMYDKIISAIDGMEIDWNDRELGRFVKSYA